MKKVIFPMLLITCLATSAQPIHDKQAIKAIMDKVNKYRFENPWQEFDNNWIRGTYYAGVMACYSATGDKAYLD
jgi:rhamnogalacturonyl hydrolase YesR